MAWLMAYSSDPFDDGGDAHAAAHAEGGQDVAQLAALQLVEQGGEDDAAGGAQRMAHGNGAAIDVDLLLRDPQVLHELEDHGGEGLVDLEQVDVLDTQAGLGQRLAGSR